MSSYRMKYKIGLMEHSLVVPEDISSIPLGTILPYSANTLNPPAGFLFCDGSAISRSMYSDLFALIGTLYGSGDGSTTFNLPNLIGRFAEGASSAGTSKDAGLPNIEGNLFLGIPTSATGELNSLCSEELGDSGALVPRTAVMTNRTYFTIAGYTTRAHATGIKIDASRSSTVYGNSDTVTPPSLTVRYIIKAFHTVSNESAILDISNITSDIATRLQRQQVPAFNQRIEITTSQTWSAPVNGWYKFTIKGGGGGGERGSYTSGNTSYRGGMGGGEGGITLSYEKMVAGQTATIVIGAGGAGGTSGSSEGSQGGNTTVAVNNKTLTGGGGYSGYSGGCGGTGTIRGASGGTRDTNTGAMQYVAYGGNGGGNGSYGVVSNATPSKAYQGAGGTGGSASSGYTVYNGGAGGDGYVWIEYFDPTL